jgi:hypothetical protein
MAGVHVVKAVLNGVPKGSYHCRPVVEVPGVTDAPILGAAVAVKQTGLLRHMDWTAGAAVTEALWTRIVVVAITVQPCGLRVPIIVYVVFTDGLTKIGLTFSVAFPTDGYQS